MSRVAPRPLKGAYMNITGISKIDNKVDYKFQVSDYGVNFVQFAANYNVGAKFTVSMGALKTPSCPELQRRFERCNETRGADLPNAMRSAALTCFVVNHHCVSGLLPHYLSCRSFPLRDQVKVFAVDISLPLCKHKPHSVLTSAPLDSCC